MEADALKGQKVIDFPKRAGVGDDDVYTPPPPPPSSTSSSTSSTTTSTTTTTTQPPTTTTTTPSTTKTTNTGPLPPTTDEDDETNAPAPLRIGRGAPPTRDAAYRSAAGWLAGGRRRSTGAARLRAGHLVGRDPGAAHGRDRRDHGPVGGRARALHPEGLGGVGPVLARLLLRPAVALPARQPRRGTRRLRRRHGRTVGPPGADRRGDGVGGRLRPGWCVPRPDPLVLRSVGAARHRAGRRDRLPHRRVPAAALDQRGAGRAQPRPAAHGDAVARPVRGGARQRGHLGLEPAPPRSSPARCSVSG